MDADELFFGSHHKFLKDINLSKYNNENGDNCFKCNLDEVNKLLSIKRLLLEQPRFEKCVSLSEAEWDDDLKLAKVTKIAKNLTKNFSHSRNKSIYLYPEECLCLLEMKCLILKWNEKKMSIKNAYALLLAPGNDCTFNQFRTYGYLVKLGFRVFKYDSKLKNDNYDPKNLTRLPEISSKKKKSNINNFKIKNKIENLYCNKSLVPFPKLESSGWVVISRQPSIYLPHNLQPNYDVYSFNITIKSNTTVITEAIAFYETMDKTKIPFCPRECKVFESPLPTGMYPVYEKNIPKTIKSEIENIYEPQVKRFKQTKFEEDLVIINRIAASTSDKNNIQVTNTETNLINKKCDHFMDHVENNECDEKVILPINIDMEIIESKDKSVHLLNKVNLIEKVHDDFSNKKNIAIEENNISINMATSTSNDNYNTSVLKNEINSTNKIYSSLNIKETKADSISNISSSNYSGNGNEDHESTTSYIIPEDTTFDVQLNLPNHIRQKLFAIKPTTVHDATKSANNKYRIRYDVYYPDNEVPKTSRPAPDFRVIVFEEDLDSFPNVYSVNASNPIDNVTTLWAIVNSSSVSFYNVNNIILPKSTDWDLV